MFRYSAFGLVIASEFDLPDLPPAAGDTDVTFRFGSIPRELRLTTAGDEVQRFRNTGAFRIIEGREVVIDPLAGADPVSVRTLLLGTVMAYLMQQRGWLALHGSGVIVASEAVLFLGHSGAGKSTVAAAFHALGYDVISDDVCPVQVMEKQCWVRGSWPRLRLAEGSRTLLEDLGLTGQPQVDKHSYQLPSTTSNQLIQVRRIYILEPGDQIVLTPQAPFKALCLLSENSFAVRRRMDRESLENHLRDCAGIAATVPVVHLVRPANLVDLKYLAESIRRDIESG